MKEASFVVPMFGSNTISLPSPFLHDHRPARFHTEPARPQHTGQCYFQILHAGSREQRCACQGFEQNRSAPGNVCDCTHAACYHAHSTFNESSHSHDGVMSNGGPSLALLERVQKLEDALRMEREFRESLFKQERKAWEREVTILREDMATCYNSEADMQKRMVEIEDKLDGAIKEQTRLNAKLRNVADTGISPRAHQRDLPAGRTSADHQARPALNGISPHIASVQYSGSEGRTSASAEPMSPRQSTQFTAEQESPRSSGILNLVEHPRPAFPRYALPPRLSPPAESEEPRSSGFLGVDVKELIQRRNQVNGTQSVSAYRSPSISTTKSSSISSGRNLTPQSSARISPPNVYLNGSVAEAEDRAYKKRKHQPNHMALDVLANVSAASPVIS